MEEFLKNVNNPPETVEAGQIWHSMDYNKDFLIIDVGDDEDIYVALLLSSVPEVFADGIDVVLEKKRFGFLASDKLAMRLTRGPVCRDQLNYYLGSINNETLERVMSTVGILENRYDEDQQILFREVLRDLECVRWEAVKRVLD